MQKESGGAGKVRYRNIDLIKFIAMFMVVAYHAMLADVNFLEKPDALHYFRYSLRYYLSASVPLFFAVNGFLLINKKLDIHRHIRKTIHMIAVTLIWAILCMVLSDLVNHRAISVSGIFFELFAFEHSWITYLWFMGALVCIYLLYPLIKSAYEYNRTYFYLFTAMCCVFTFGNNLLNMLAAVVYNSLSGNTMFFAERFMDLNFNFGGSFNPLRGIYGFAFSYFCIGCCIAANYGKIEEYVLSNRRKLTFICSLILALTGMLMLAWGVYSSNWRGELWNNLWGGTDCVFTAVNAVCIFIICIPYKGSDGKAGKLIETVAANTLGIYFVHMILINCAMEYMLRLKFVKSCTGSLLYSVVIMMLSLGIVLVMKKLPLVSKLVKM